MATIGFLGLGNMGAAMARRLVDAGHEVHVWNRSRPAVDDLVAAGAVAAETPGAALATGISFSMLADDDAALAVLDDAAFQAGTGIHVSHASISPEAADRLAARAAAAGMRYVSATVLGRPAVAAAGQLNIVAAGPSDALDEVAPFLDVLGKRTWRMGENPRMANAVKIAVNYNLLAAIEALGESIAMVERQGVDPELFAELLGASLFGGIAHTGYGTEIATRAYDPPAFAMALGLKDLTLAEGVAGSTGVTLSLAPAIRRAFEVALADPELAGLDWGAVAEVTRQDKLG